MPSNFISLLFLLALVTHILSLSLPHQPQIQAPLGDFSDELELPSTLRYAAFGDSWASGVNWGEPNADTEFDFPDDTEVCRCRRMREAYPAQILDDKDRSWLGDRGLELDFVACHGAFFQDIEDQVRRLNKERAPDFATLMIGGNPAGFGEIIENCLFQFNKDRDYGPEYPDQEGECFKTLQQAHERIDAWWFQKGLWDAIYSILKEPRIWNNPNFRLYVLGYAGLFNHDDEKCDDWTFGYLPGKQPRLKKELRLAINRVLDHARDIYEDLVNHDLFSPKVRFVDLNQVLGGHRFCEPTEAGTFQAQVDNSWLYALAWPNCIPLTNHNTSHNVSLETLGFCRNCGGFGELGELQRIFHPKREGHEAYARALKRVVGEHYAER